MIWGLQPGPMLFVEQKEFVWGLIASMYLGNIVGLLVVLTCVPVFAAILRVPFSIIAPLILVLCAIGAYSVHSSTFDVMLMLVFGVIGYLLKKSNYPLAPLVLAIVLGDKAEEAFRQSLLGSQGSLGVFFSNTLVSTIMSMPSPSVWAPTPPIRYPSRNTPRRPKACSSRRRRPGRSLVVRNSSSASTCW